MSGKPLDCDTVRVRWLTVAADASGDLGRWHEMLDGEEVARADRFRFAADRETFIASHALTRAMLSEVTGRPIDTWRYVKGAFGKPALATDCGCSGLHFNISHTRGFAACAIARADVGVDIEASDRRTDFALANHFFAPEEADIVRSVPAERRASVFFRFWTLKEAFIKATGEGLSRPLDSFSFTFNPLDIRFHREREDWPREDDPLAWQFAEFRPTGDLNLALAVKRARQRPLRFDVGIARSEEIG
jgi:4'-phosphopantetheinyl transferase